MSNPSERLWKRSSARGGICSSNQSESSETEDAETVMDMVTMLSCQDPSNAQRILLAMTGSAESCEALRKTGCISLLIQILHPINIPPDDHPTSQAKLRAAQTLKNVVQFNCDERMKKKETRVLELLESLRSYIDYLKSPGGENPCIEEHPIPSATALMKLSMNEDYRNAMCFLGAIHTLADLIQTDHAVHGINESVDCLTMRRFNGMTLTNLTVGNKRNKLLLGTMREFMTALVAQLESPSEDVCQVTASVLRNLSWHASSALRASLVESNAVPKLMITAINAKKESNLKVVLSALWNLSAHSLANKIAICQTPDAIDFLVSLLESPVLTIKENSGGILTNISIVTTTDENTRERFRTCGILEILLDHLQSPSILVVGNACGMLWHLSNCKLNQEKLVQLGAIRKLRALSGSKHERIKHGAFSTLRNILSDENISNCQQREPSPLSMINNTSNSPNEILSADEQQQPMDLRIGVSALQPLEPKASAIKPDLELLSNEQPLDLSFHSSKSTPIHTVSASEFGLPSRNNSATMKGIPFLNPPLQSKNAFSYDSPKNYNSCPEFVHCYALQPAGAHKGPLDFSPDQVNARGEDTDATINYSLHFPELPEDTVIIKNEDTVKTYYCEGTPLNFSTPSNSMTDLTQVDKSVKLKPIIETETIDDLPRKYCTEWTPANFSRASSLSSIASNLQGGENKAEYFEESAPKLTNGSSKDKGKRNVTFSAADTPLMFSRTSSVNSLDSVEVNYEDTGSVVSEFSRRVSGIVSPSELPDSPRQIEPPEPRPFDIPVPVSGRNGIVKEDEQGLDTVKIFAKSGESCAVSGIQSARSLSPLTIDDGEDDTKIGLIETSNTQNQNDTAPEIKTPKEENDETRVFGVEDTPWRGISTATSLSDLVDEMEQEERKELGNEKQLSPPRCISSPPPPPLPPKPNSNAVNKAKIEPPQPAATGAVDTTPVPAQTTLEVKFSIPGPSQRLPKSKSELSKLNTKAIKMSTSYHENLKRENQLDPELAALIMKGKSRVKGNKATTAVVSSKNVNGKILPHPPEDKKTSKHSRTVTITAQLHPAVSAVTVSELKKSVSAPLPKVEKSQSSKLDKNLSASNVDKSLNTFTSKTDKSLNNTSKTDKSLNTVGSKTDKLGSKLDDVTCGQGQESTTTSMASEWNEDTLSLSVPSLSISAAFKLAQSDLTVAKGDDDTLEKVKGQLQRSTPAIGILETSSMVLQQSTISNIEGTGQLEVTAGSFKKCKSGGGESNLYNQKPPPEFDLDSSMISVASLKTEIASIGPLEEGMRELSIGGETYTLGGGGCGSDFGTDAEDSFFDDTDHHSGSGQGQGQDDNDNGDSGILGTISASPSPLLVNRFMTYTARKHSSSRQKRRDDPERYLTRTISSPSRDSNGNSTHSPTYLSTFGGGGDRAPRIVKPSATSNESSPTSSPKGIRGRRKPLYSSLPPQKRHGSGPAVPPKPLIGNGGVVGLVVRPTRTSELRAASSRDSSPKNSSKNSSNSSLNNSASAPPVVIASSGHRKTPPKPPVRSSASSSFRSFAVVRAVRNSNSSIGFSVGGGGGGAESEPPYSTLPRSLKVNSVDSESHNGGKEQPSSKVGKLSTFWNQLMKAKDTKHGGGGGGNGVTENGGAPPAVAPSNDKKSKFGFSFGKKKKQNCSTASNLTTNTNWISCAENFQVHTKNPPLNQVDNMGNLNTQIKANQHQAPQIPHTAPQAQQDVIPSTSVTHQVSSTTPTSTFSSSRMTPV